MFTFRERRCKSNTWDIMEWEENIGNDGMSYEEFQRLKRDGA